MALDNVLSVAVLPAGASAVMAHGISDIYGALKPNFIRPDRATAIGVSACDATSVTFTNYGNQTESAFFHVSRDHSIQQAGNVELFWQGSAGLTSFQLALPQWEDLQIPDTSVRPGGTAPGLVTFRGNMRLYSFAAGELVEMTTQLRHAWKQGTAIKPHIHCSFPDANAGNYVWQLEYTMATPGGTYPVTQVIETPVTAAPGVAFGHQIIDFPALDMTGMGISTIIHAVLIRKTGVAGAYASEIFLNQFDYHIQHDTLGSRQEYIK